jgi:dihydrofolate reductase
MESLVGKVRVRGFAVSIDGFGAGPDQSLEHPLGKRGGELMNWFYPTRAFRSMIGQDGGTDDRFARAAAEGFGAFILGRNMFGPAGDDWGGPDWKGWWGDNPSYHAPTFILTHHARAPIVMEGGTTFHFVTGGIEAALARAKAAAGDLDVKVGGGCPSSNALRQVRRFPSGGSGSSELEVMRPAADAASGVVGWSVA